MRRIWKAAIAALFMTTPAWAGSSGKVWIEPFSELNQPQQQTQPDWINRALVQSVSDDLSAIKGMTVMTPATLASAPATRPSDVDYVVSATIQRINGDLRVTGRVEDTSTHQLMGGFKATGSEPDLFAIEDSLAAQLKYILAPQAPTPPAQQPSTTTATGAPNTPFATQRPQFEGSDLQRSLQERDYLRRMEERNALLYQPAPDYTYTQPVYPVDYGYNPYAYGYNYPYGWYGGSVVVINGQRCYTNNTSHRWNRGGSGCDFVANPGGSPTQTLDTNGQRIRHVASYGGINNVPSVMVNTPTSAPQLVPTRGVEMTTRGPQLVPSSSPQLVPSGGPQLVPSGGPQLVPGGRR